MITFYGVPGTWAMWPDGFQADVARGLDGAGEWDAVFAEIIGNDTRFRWQGVGYPASFGPINPPPWAGNPAPSYDDSVSLGVDELVRLILGDPNPFALSGYSQGAEVVGRVRNELAAGRLQHRQQDCRLSLTFGDPTRQPTDEVYGGGSGAGISRLVVAPNTFRCVTYAVPGDMYCTTPVSGVAGDDMHAVYSALTSLGGTLSFLELVTQVAKMLGNPIEGVIGAIDALIRAAQVQAHGTYGPWVGHAQAIVNALPL